MKLNIAVLPGDGIGPEIAAQGVEVMSAVCKKFGHEVRYEYALCGADAIDKVGDPFPEETYDWEMDQPLKHPYDGTILYRLHVRGFTRHTSSGTGERGTFRALTEKIPYLKELGITAVELMMPNEFQEVMMEDGADGNPYATGTPTGRLNYWGYGAGYLFAPKASYTSGKEKEPERELRIW